MPLRQIVPQHHKRQTPDVALAIVNIVLLLIFFFLITGRLTSAPSFALELSETAELPVENLPRPILVVDSGGLFELDGEPILEEALAEALADDTLLHLLIDRNETAQVLIDMLGREDFAHLEIRLVTIHRAGDNPAGTP